MFYVHENLNTTKPKKITYIKDVLKLLAKKTICLQQIDKKRTEKVHTGKLHNLHRLQIRSINGVIKSRITMGGIINLHGLSN
jgi:hypothetical protein